MEAVEEMREQQAKVMKRHLGLVPEDVRARILLANHYAARGDEADAVAELRTAVAMRPNDSNILYNAACSYALLNRKQDALTLLKRAKDAGFLNIDWASKDPDLVCLHDEPEFRALVGH
jgi:adenylate cyclase